MDTLKELLAKIENVENLSLEELTQLEAEIASTFTAITAGELEGVESDDIETLSKLAESQTSVRTRGAELVAEVETKQAKIAELASQVAIPEVKAEGEEEVTEPEAEPATEPEAEEVVEAEPVVEAEVVSEVIAEAEEVVAETKPAPLQALAASTRQARSKDPVVTVKEEPMHFYDDRGNPTTLEDFSKSLINKRMRFNNNTPKDVEERITLGTFKEEFSADQTLDSLDLEGANSKKLKELQMELMRPNNWSDGSLTASGGWVAPYQTIYPIQVIAGAQRPVRDALPRFGVDRGGIRFRKGLSITTLKAISSTGVWTQATDLSPGVSTKNIGTITNDSITEVALDAVYRQVKFGNFRQQADPEGVAAWLQGTMAVWAYEAERHLLDGMKTASTAVSTDQHLGFARDFLHQLHRGVATYRSRNRLAPDAQLRIVIPQWLPDAIAVDWIESQAAENEFTTLTYAQVIAQMEAMNVNVTLYADEATSEGQIYGAQGIFDLLGWKASAKWFLFHEGAFTFLDGGSLDLGLVRDSTLNKTNDVQTFAENFENVAFTGVESLYITSNISVNGAASLAIDNHTQSQS